MTTSYKSCAVCKAKHGPVFAFPGTLRYHGIKGTFATVACIRQLARKSVKEVMDVVKRTEGPSAPVGQSTTERVTEIYQQLAANRPAFRKLIIMDRRDV
jgi:hypothetical protein